MAHVGVTRARDKLFVTSTRVDEKGVFPIVEDALQRLRKAGKLPSPYVLQPSCIRLPRNSDGVAFTCHPVTAAELLLISFAMDHQEEEKYSDLYGEPELGTPTPLSVCYTNHNGTPTLRGDAEWVRQCRACPGGAPHASCRRGTRTAQRGRRRRACGRGDAPRSPRASCSTGSRCSASACCITGTCRRADASCCTCASSRASTGRRTCSCCAC